MGSTVTTREQIPTTAIDESCDKHDGEREVSISRLEVERAIRSGLVLFTFVDAEVLSEHRFFDQNRDESDHIHWSTVDSIRVFEFIDFIKGASWRNPVFEFRTPIEIQDILRDQLSGLLREFLERERMAEYRSHIDHIIHSAEKLQSLQQELRQREEAMRMQMREMQLPDHPFYSSLRRSAGAAFRIYFKHYEEMLEVLAVVGYVPVDPEEIQKGKADRMIYFYSERQDVGRAIHGGIKNVVSRYGRDRAAACTRLFRGQRMARGQCRLRKFLDDAVIVYTLSALRAMLLLFFFLQSGVDCVYVATVQRRGTDMFGPYTSAEVVNGGMHSGGQTAASLPRLFDAEVDATSLTKAIHESASVFTDISCEFRQRAF